MPSISLAVFPRRSSCHRATTPCCAAPARANRAPAGSRDSVLSTEPSSLTGRELHLPPYGWWMQQSSLTDPLIASMVDGEGARVVRTVCQLRQRWRIKEGPSPPLPPLALIPS